VLALVYEYMEGGSLAALLREGGREGGRGFDLRQLAQDVAEGMEYLHRRGVMHRDLKVWREGGREGGKKISLLWQLNHGFSLHSLPPSLSFTQPDNLLLDKNGRCVIRDFGLVCPTISEGDHTGTSFPPSLPPSFPPFLYFLCPVLPSFHHSPTFTCISASSFIFSPLLHSYTFSSSPPQVRRAPTGTYPVR